MRQIAHDDGRERLTHAVAAASLAVSFIYITWRWGWTLDPDALWLSVPLALAETYGLMAAALLTFTAWRLRHREAPAPLPGRTVDVFVTTTDEPITIIRKTALAARELRYPHTTWILDDGGREDVRRLAAQLSVGYLARDDRRHGKAGNINYALGETAGELILQLDADHVPLPHMLDRLVGFFADDRLAFVQSSQDFYNVDALADDVNGRRRQIWGDQERFYRVVQPGKDRVNAALLLGSCALVRRSALEEIGGLATDTLSEGLGSSLQLHARGWRSAYLAERLAFGLAPASARAYHARHLRWGQGAMQVIRRHHPMIAPGLTLAQRAAYLESLTSYFAGYQRLVLYLAPIIFFATNVFPLRASAGTFALLFLPHIVLRAASFALLTRGHGSLLLADRLEMARFFTQMRSVAGLVISRPLTLRVPKHDEDRVSLRTAGPQLAIVMLTAAALGWGLYERLHGYVDVVPGWGVFALWTMLVLALWNAAIAANVIHLSLGGAHRRNEHRFADSLAVAVRVLRPDNKLAGSERAVTENLTPTGLALRGTLAMAEGARVEVTLPLTTGEIQVRGRVVRSNTRETPVGTVYLTGVEFDSLTLEALEAIDLHCAHRVSALEPEPAAVSGSSGPTLRRLRELRGARRRPIGIPARVTGTVSGVTTELGDAVLVEASPRGGQVLLDQPVEEGTILTLRVPGTTQMVSGTAEYVQAMQTAAGLRFAVGFATAVGQANQQQTARRWFEEVTRLATRAGTTAANRSRLVSGQIVAQSKVIGAHAAKHTRAAGVAAGAVAGAAAKQSREVTARVLAQSKALGTRAATQTRAVSAAAGAATTKLLDQAGRQLRRPGRTVGAAPPELAESSEADVAPLMGMSERALRQRLEAVRAVPTPEPAPVVEAVASAPADTDTNASEAEPDTDWTIDGEFDFPGELSVGGTFVVRLVPASPPTSGRRTRRSMANIAGRCAQRGRSSSPQPRE
jgi:Glycosyltransferases, probably involved in cell wall biogenesis